MSPKVLCINLLPSTYHSRRFAQLSSFLQDLGYFLLLLSRDTLLEFPLLVDLIFVLGLTISRRDISIGLLWI